MMPLRGSVSVAEFSSERLADYNHSGRETAVGKRRTDFIIQIDDIHERLASYARPD